MKIALYGQTFPNASDASFNTLISKIIESGAKLFIFETFNDFIKGRKINLPLDYKVFNSPQTLPRDTSFLFSFGGDGTFLQTVKIVGNSGIPVIGINAGRLGFLANISDDNLSESLDALFSGRFFIEDRALITLEVPNSPANKPIFALNDITIHKMDMGMITIHVELDGEYLNSYWADGLIISTPTGSTAYSMSVGGPIVLPGSENLIISPVSPHNLTVRPLVIPDSKKIKLKISCRSDKFLVSCDSLLMELNTGSEMIIKKANHTMKLARIRDHSYYNTLRNKLMWGIDKRN